jgi:alpha-soluble NSF attachment protein
LKTLGNALEEEDVEAFTEAVAEYDSVSRLEQWYTTLLLRVKKSISSDGELC